MEIQHTQEGEGDHQSPKEESQMPKWLDKQLQKKAPILMDPKNILEAILARAQKWTKKEKKPRVKSHLTMDASGSQTMQIATLVVEGEGFNYNISTIDIGTTTKEQKIDHLQGSVTTTVHQMNKDKSSKEELKAQVVDLTTYIQQWSSAEELPITSSAPPQLLSKDHINKLERRKNWTKAMKEWFRWVVYNGDMGTGHAT